MYTFIVNPNARSGLGVKVWGRLESELLQRGVKYQVYQTKYQRHATSIVKELTSDGCRHTLIVLGGDGTINEVINGIHDLEMVTLGYIPIGSSNDFARGFGLPADSIAALNYILAPAKYAYMNVGSLTCQNLKKRFAVSTGIGFDAGVCHEAATSRLKKILNKIKLGKLTYAAIALHRIISLKPGKMSITLDDTKTFELERVFFAAAMNHLYEGGGFKFCPKADPCDDVLDIIVIADMPKLKALLLLPTAFKGWHIYFKGVHTYKCKKADILSETALPVHTDGEPVFPEKQISASLEDKKLRVIIT